MSIAFRRPKADPYIAPAPAVFLHTSWRTAGTWIWHRFRANPATMAFYEPLHEELSALSLDRITDTNISSWESGHPETAPYFLEFAPLLSSSKRGVCGFHRSFAFERFFMKPDEANDRLRDYLGRLHNLAFASGRRPVFKFVRSLGRAGWMRENFPKATHVGVIRDPIVQWESCYRLAQRGRSYFLAMPAALLAAHHGEPVVRAVTAVLDLRLGPLRSHDFRVTVKRAEAFVAQASPETTYQVMLAFWLTTAIASLPHVDMIVDSDLLSESRDYRHDVSEQFGNRTGIEIDFADPRVPEHQPPALDVATLERLHEAARHIVQSFAPPAVAAEKLDEALARYVSPRS